MRKKCIDFIKFCLVKLLSVNDAHRIIGIQIKF
jgi:hypothetical protein